MSHDNPKRARWVRCPACSMQALYSPENPARPFCSARCRSVDLGAWASESYRVAVDKPSDTDETPPGPETPH